MFSLTVAHASGLIAAVVFIVQLFVPLAITLVLVGFLREEDSAVTWSVVGRTLHSTYWPLLLGSDTSAHGGVRRLVYFISVAIPGTLAVIAIASVVTPLGLYETFQPTDGKVPMPFQYAPDMTPMGYGTPERSALQYTRYCYNMYPVNCPGSHNVINRSGNQTLGNYELPYGYNTSIALNVTDVFDSGRNQFDGTLSSIWDIQWRSYVTAMDQDLDNGSARVEGTYRTLQSLILEDGLMAVEGLIVDMVSGGIGLRNHTVPIQTDVQMTWSEDLLFIQPKSTCVDTNLTLDFTLSDTQAISNPKNVVLTDRGGFTHVHQGYPVTQYVDAQKDLDLRFHAWKAATLNNLYAMLYMNVTNPKEEGVHEAFEYLNSYEGKEFALPEGNDISARAIRMGTLGSFLGQFTNSSYNTSGFEQGYYPNPWNVTNSDLLEAGRSSRVIIASSQTKMQYIGDLCRLALGGDNVNISNIGISCGLMYGAAQTRDGADGNSFDPGSNWTIPIFSCATANKAMIKTVDLAYNGSNGLKDLQILSIRDKSFFQDEELPIWAVENRQDLKLATVKPLWGLVSPESANDIGIQTIRREFLWLPETADDAPFGFIRDNIAGSQFHSQARTAVYKIGDETSFLGSSITSPSDYSGQTNVALFFKWRKLTESASAASNILDLVWTDIATNAVVGTRAWGWSARPSALPRRNDDLSPGSIVQVPVTLWQRHLRYHAVYAIPAITAAILVVLAIAAVIVLFILRRSGLSKLRWYLNHTSTGRILTTFLYTNDCEPQAPTSAWLGSVGERNVNLKDPVPRASSHPENPELGDNVSSASNSTVSLIDSEASQPALQTTTAQNIHLRHLRKQNGRISDEI